MNFRLPILDWQGHKIRLALSTEATARLVVALLNDRDARLVPLSQLLQSESRLALWALCAAPQLQTVPPADAFAIATWFNDVAIPDGILNAELSENDLVEEPQLDVDPSQYPAELAAAPWIPTWLSIGLTDQTDSQSPPQEPCKLVEDVAARLPTLLSQLRRIAVLEKDFATALEKEKIASMRELAYGASHEINNPLANIATRAQTLLRDEVNPERKRKLATIAAQAFRAHEMIADMMLFAKPPQPVLRQTDLGQLLDDVIREMRVDAETQHTEIVCEPLTELKVSADSNQLSVAIKALLRNALEVLVKGGTISVRVSQRLLHGKRWVEITVRDSGPGISPEVRRHLFDPFYSGREAGRGLGFGLAKAWRIAELHRGMIEVESEPGFGAAFTLKLPAAGD